MDLQEPLLDDLSSGDTTKQTNALTRLMQLASGGRDISIYFNSIVQNCLVPNDHRLKLLGYRVLQKCHLIDSEWENKVILYITRDCQIDDQNIAVAALELIPHISASSILVDFIGKLIFLTSFNHPAPGVRRVAVETLALVLLQRKGVMQAKSLVASLWGSIVSRVLDDPHVVVFQAAFRAVSTLFDSVENLSPIDSIDSFGDGFHETRAFLLQKTATDVKNLLIPHFDLLLKRIDFMELPYRAPAVNVLTFLIKEIPKDPLSQAPKNITPLYPLMSTGALVPSFVENHLLPYLTHADDGLAFACGKAILRIWAHSETYRKDWAISATLGLVGILRRETIAASPSTVITEILRVLPVIPEAHLVSCTLKLISSISDFTESLNRQRNILQIFDWIVKKDLASEGKIFSELFKDPWLQSVWTTDAPFREELLSAMVTKYNQVKSRYLDTKGKLKFSDNERISYLISSLKFVQLCNDTLKWQTMGRTHAVEQYVRFIDWLLEHVKYLPRLEDFEQIWTLQAQTMRNLLGNMKIIVSDGICLQVIFIVCKYSPELEPPEEQAILSTLQHIFLLSGESAAQKELAASAAKAGSLVDSSALHVPQTPYMQGVLECVHILGLRFPNMAVVVRQILDDVASAFSTDEPLVKRTRILQQKINPNQKTKASLIAFDTNSTDFSFCPPIEFLDTLNTFESPNDKFKLDYKKSTTHKPIHKFTPTHPNKKILSGAGDPFSISAAHFMRPEIYSIIFRVRILNQMAFAYSNLQVSVGLCGALQFTETSDSMQTVKKLLPEEKTDLDFPILVTGYETGSAIVTLTFSMPGDASLEADTSLGYEDYGKNYTVTCVNSDVYEFDVGEFLHPLEYLPSEFLGEWNRFPAGFVLDVNFDQSLTQKDLFEKISSLSTSFHQVLQWSYSEHYFQLAYSAMTWFEDQLCFVVIGHQSTTHQISARFGFRASDPAVLSIFHAQVGKWFDSWTGVGKYTIVNRPSSIFCSTSDEENNKPNKLAYDAEEEMLQNWQKKRFARNPPIIPVPTQIPNGAQKPASPPQVVPISTVPPVDDIDFL